MTTYDYVTMPIADVLALTATFDAATMPGAYISDDASARTYRDLLAAGYRWIRTEDGQAIFEKEETRR